MKFVLIKQMSQNSLTGITDIDLLIVKYLSSPDIENLSKCIKLKDDVYWRKRLSESYFKLDYKHMTVENYLRYIKFSDYFLLTLYVALLQDYYANQFSIYFLVYITKTKKHEGYFNELMTEILNLIKDKDILTLEDHLVDNKEKVESIYNKYLEHYIPGNIQLTNLSENDNLYSYIHRKIFTRQNIFTYSFYIIEPDILRISFKCDDFS